MAVKKRSKEKGGLGFSKKNRLGLSTTVIILVLISIALIAIFLLWGPIKRIIQKQSEVAEIQNKFFNEQINIISVNFNQQFVNVTIRKPSGQITASIVNITLSGSGGPVESDLYSVVDLSGSMRQCNGSTLTSTRCVTNMGGVWNSPICTSLQYNDGPTCLSYGATWSDRLTAAQDANRQMIDRLLGASNNRIGLVAYRNVVVNSNSTDLTNNVNTLNTTINSWQASSNTCICCGINNATNRLALQSTEEKLKSMIVMSDGEANIQCPQQPGTDPKQDAIQAACDANASLKNLVIYSIGVEGADEATLTAIATCGGGRYYSVLDADDLISVYQAIATQIEERYESFTALAFLYVVFYNETSVVWEKVPEIPGVLETRTYDFDLNGKLSGAITRIEIYPVVLDSSRKEIIGPMLDYWQAV